MIADKSILTKTDSGTTDSTASSGATAAKTVYYTSGTVANNGITLEEAVETNAMYEAYMSVRTILETIREDPNDSNSPPFFKTIKLDNGQLSRVKLDKANYEYGIIFPAVFIHYIDVYYNQGTSKIAEGRGTMRIHYVLNRLNNSDDGIDNEGEGLKVFNTIVKAIESQKANFTPLVSRFQLQYWDQPLSFDDGLQPYWIDYQIYFKEYTAYAYKEWVDIYLTEPPLTQPSDQTPEVNSEGLEDYTEPDIEDVAGYETFS